MREVYPRQNGKSTLLLNFIKLQDELGEVKYKNYLQSVQTHLLEEENNKLKKLLKECRDVAEFTKTIVNKNKWFNDVIAKIDEVLK